MLVGAGSQGGSVGSGRGAAKEYPISAVELGERGRCGWGGPGGAGARLCPFSQPPAGCETRPLLDRLHSCMIQIARLSIRREQETPG